MTYRLHPGDCRNFFPTFEPGSFDAIITDPPYNVSEEGKEISRETGKFQGSNIRLDFGEWDRNEIKWEDYIDFFPPLLKPCGVLVMFYDKLYLGTIGIYLQDRYGFQVRHIGSLIKRNPAPQVYKVKWQNGVECFLVATKNKGTGHHFNRNLGQSPDWFETSNNYEHEHPTQKPLPAMEWIVQYWTFEGDMVLDPFAGSGTTGVACIETGRNCVLIEKHAEYYRIAKRRMAEAKPLLFHDADYVPIEQLSLFGKECQ